uniref:tRNA nucleotidyltransferase/poly(A) polymerase n=1 Tax=Paulinella micropora TaxID=1928728 RepID=A0A385I0G7_9EUKA|nr:tRNA nucleotidyltransferase/poly(A) polymerase [Paulinella micropora]AXY63417.1 tRNA nucleotidyltransferase/poly(A) polymerase [Paulinella micropora]
MVQIVQELIRQLEVGTRNTRLALVGGIVRDWLLHRIYKEPWNGPGDLDLVVEFSMESHVNAHALAERLISLHPEEITHCHYYDKYGTAEICFLWGTIDLATARQEFYPEPGHNPVISFHSLESDLARRDFRLNAMAIVVKDSRWQLLDPYGGQQDLATGWLDFLHHRSVTDDPTRLIRAARYGARLGMTLGHNSINQTRGTIDQWPWKLQSDLTSDQAPSALTTRLRIELELLFECRYWQGSLHLLQVWGALELLDKNLQVNSYISLKRRLIWGNRLGISLLLALISAARDPVTLATRLQLPKNQIQWLRQVEKLQELLAFTEGNNTVNSILLSGWRPSRWCRELETRGWHPEVIALGLISGLQPRRPLLRWWFRWRHIKSPITANEIIARENFSGYRLGCYLRQLRWDFVDSVG